MRNPSALILLAALVASSTVTAGPSVDYDKAVDFTKYKTYAWKEGTPAPNPIMQKRIEEMIDQQLAALGLQKVESSPDVYVITHAELSSEQQVDVSTFGYGGYYGWGGWGGGYGTSTVSVRDVPVGTLIVDLVDAERNELAWRAMDSKFVSENPEKNTRLVQKVVTKMFTKYPQPAKTK
jgi:hypothetical protein